MATNPGLQLVSALLICTYCRNVLRQPVQTHCGHRFCLGCLEYILLSRNPHPYCDGCLDDENIPDSLLSKDKAFFDKAAIRDLNKTPIVCKNSPKCQWHGSYQEYIQIHADCCPFEGVLCINEGCQETMNRRDLEVHLHNYCEMRRQKHPFRRAICATDHGGNSNWWQVYVYADFKKSWTDEMHEIPDMTSRNPPESVGQLLHRPS
ncbi:TNF receptor-associated factor 5-like isoform X2 [Ptychodera flava]|uniref:TNF receptor-associated factor 5-like isoform X2 n=1 Tax=Ptychodera flava TaxID=63121 RepID=UPI00396A1689